MKVDYLTRSLLYLPAHKEHLIENALNSGADMLAIDLEYSCQPFENIQIGRDKIVKFLKEGLLESKKVFPRVNDRESGELLKDIYQLTLPGISGFIYPKCTNGQDIYFIGKLLETIEYEKHIPVGYFKLIPLIETTGAVAYINDVCESCPERIIAVGFGAEDYMTDLGGRHDNVGNSIFSARAIIANAAKAHGIVPLDIVHMKVHDLDDLEREMNVARDLGYEGKMLVHPKEIPVCHKCFSPSEEQVKWAEEIVLLSEEAIKEGRGVAYMNNKFIGPPMLKMAQDILKKNELCRRTLSVL
jgi:citrate lyase subunit beta/citryl-CoA lyase